MKYCRLCLVLLLSLSLFLLAGCRNHQPEPTQPLSQDSLESAREGLNHPANQVPQSVPQESFAPVDPSQLLTPTQVEDIALEHAGVSREDAVGMHTVLDLNNGRQVYEVDFQSGHLEYDYEIDAVTGQIIDWDKDV